MPKFRKRPVVVEAAQFNAADVSGGWWEAHGVRFGISKDDKGPFLMIPTPEGTMVASDGDWIIRGVKGEVYPVKPDIFEATYEPAEDPTPSVRMEEE